MVMIEKLVGLGKGLLWVPMVGIPVWKAGRRRGLGEVMEFFFLGAKEEGEKKKKVKGRKEVEGRDGGGGDESGC